MWKVALDSALLTLRCVPGNFEESLKNSKQQTPKDHLALVTECNDGLVMCVWLARVCRNVCEAA